MKLWAHILPAAAKSASANLTLPDIPEFDAAAWSVDGELYNRSFTCVEGHHVPSDDLGTEWQGWPQWPLHGHFTSKGHGPFPFWHFGPGPVGQMNAMLVNVSLTK